MAPPVALPSLRALLGTFLLRKTTSVTTNRELYGLRGALTEGDTAVQEVVNALRDEVDTLVVQGGVYVNDGSDYEPTLSTTAAMLLGDTSIGDVYADPVGVTPSITDLSVTVTAAALYHIEWSVDLEMQSAVTGSIRGYVVTDVAAAIGTNLGGECRVGTTAVASIIAANEIVNLAGRTVASLAAGAKVRIAAATSTGTEATIMKNAHLFVRRIG